MLIKLVLNIAIIAKNKPSKFILLKHAYFDVKTTLTQVLSTGEQFTGLPKVMEEETYPFKLIKSFGQ
jgi:hypothetical protein